MRIDRQKWLKTQASQDFKDHIGNLTLKQYQKQKITLTQLKELDNQFIHNNGPVGKGNNDGQAI